MFVAAWSFTGDRTYHIEFVGVLFVGLVMIGVGSWWAGRNRARQARLGGRSAATSNKKKEGKAEAKAPDADAVRYTLECPNCDHIFEVDSDAALERVSCPECGHSDAVAPHVE